MLIIRIVVVVMFAIMTIVVLHKKIGLWSKRVRQHMIAQSKKALGSASEWERPWTIYLSKAMIMFFGAMFVLLVYVVCFSIS